MKSMSRPASVLVQVIAVLALIFVIGATLLTVANLYRSSAGRAVESRDLRTVGRAVVESVLVQLREDAVGRDGIPYNGR